MDCSIVHALFFHEIFVKSCVILPNLAPNWDFSSHYRDQNLLDQIFFWPNFFQILFHKIFFKPEKFWTKKFFGPKIFWRYNFFEPLNNYVSYFCVAFLDAPHLTYLLLFIFILPKIIYHGNISSELYSRRNRCLKKYNCRYIYTN